MSARRKMLIAAAMCLSVLVAGCLRYERQFVPFQTPQSSPNAVYMDGAVIAARSFIDAPQARAAFGFDIRAAGILPVQVVFDNKSPHPLMIVAEQTFLIDAESNVWPILDQNLAYDRLASSTEWGRVAPEAAKRGVLFGAAGVVSGGAQAALDPSDVEAKIREDLKTKTLQYRAVRPGELAHGFIFYPGEAKTAKVLRLQVRETDTGKISTFNMKLP